MLVVDEINPKMSKVDYKTGNLLPSNPSSATPKFVIRQAQNLLLISTPKINFSI